MEDERRTWLDLRSREAGLGGMAGPRDGVEGRCSVTEVGVVSGRGVSREELAGGHTVELGVPQCQSGGRR
jgi:hypothetical protein